MTNKQLASHVKNLLNLRFELEADAGELELTASLSELVDSIVEFVKEQIEPNDGPQVHTRTSAVLKSAGVTLSSEQLARVIAAAGLDASESFYNELEG